MNSILNEKQNYQMVKTKDSRDSESTVHSAVDACDEHEFDLDVLFDTAHRKMVAVQSIWDTQTPQPHITSQMIQKVVDWLFGNFWRLDLGNDVVFLTLNIMRLYLKNQSIQKSKLQALGVTSMFIASKFIMVERIKIEQIVELCQQIYSKEEIVDMEYEILSVIDYNLDLPTFDCYVECLKTFKSLSSEEQHKMMFWLQLSTVSELLTESNGERIVLDLFQFVTGGRCFWPDWMEKLKKFSETTQLRYVMKKFMSLFDVDEYLESIQSQ